ncbi:early nodulin-like protein 1 [Andrographis paniculata]|uniref:early nodulin-like protein 1 n=1 Tax=Andrographis paniculata TaxID=175694 RepID=UPI0021E99DDF|nr:early nodulin-like protein 1 [Andrographis paniculata]
MHVIISMGNNPGIVVCTYLCMCLILLTGMGCSSSRAHEFPVGWVVRPAEPYPHWAERLRFQVNDTLRFKYNKDSDTVAVVNSGDYAQCSAGNPLVQLAGGNSVFKFDRSGPFFFITGNKSNCAQGQKLIIVVLAVRSPPPPPPVAAAPAPAPAPTGRNAPPKEGSSGGGGGGGSPHTPSAAVAVAPASSRWAVVVVPMVSGLVFSMGFGLN